jgi:ribosomal protein S18 acetylase RimI-like enzyme
MSPRDIELATIRTWPAAETEARHGWFYLAAGGVTGRVNAVWPLGWTGASLDAAIDDAEAWYAARGLPPRFKLTDGAFAPDDLPQALARRGYAPVTPTLVMTALLKPRAAPDGVLISATMPPAFDAVLRAVSKDDAEYDERRNIALRAPQPAAFAMIKRDGRAAAIGMSAAAGDLAGVFLMRTAPEARRQGLARRILAALLARMAEGGVRTAFLQVEADNAPAVALYESDGFAPLSAYRFWRKAITY